MKEEHFTVLLTKSQMDQLYSSLVREDPDEETIKQVRAAFALAMMSEPHRSTFHP